MIPSLKCLALLALPSEVKQDLTFDLAQVREDTYVTMPSKEMMAVGPSARGQIWSSAHERLHRDMQPPSRAGASVRDARDESLKYLAHLTGMQADLGKYGAKLERQVPVPSQEQVMAFVTAREQLQQRIDSKINAYRSETE